MRVGALQDWPTLRKAAATPAGTARARSASGRMRLGDFPPSSWATRFTVGRRRLGNQDAGPRRTGDRDHVHVRMRRQRGADLRPIAVHQVEHTRRDAGVVHHFGKEQGAQGRQLAGLQNDRTSRCQGGADLGGDLVERPVPGGDQAAHADGLAHDGHVPPMGDERIAARIVAGHADVLRRDGTCVLRAKPMAAPISSEIAWANSSARSRIRAWTRSRSKALLWAELTDQVANARRAAATAAATSLALPSAISATGSSVDGSTTELRACVSGTTHSPPTNMRSRRPALLRCSMMEEFTESVLWKRRQGCSLPSIKAWPRMLGNAVGCVMMWLRSGLWMSKSLGCVPLAPVLQ